MQIGDWGMNLSLREFSDIVAVLKSSNRGSSEHRRASRTSIYGTVTAFVLELGHINRTYTLLTRDISTSGLGAFQSLNLPVKSQVLLELPRTTGPLMICASIMHCRPVADRIYAMGMAFSEAPSAELLEHRNRFLSDPEERVRRAMLD